MNLSLIEIIRKLVAQGHEVEYTHRKDGGYVIRSIDGTRFSGKTGNAFARRIVGATLSHARQVQLARIKLPKGRKYTKQTEIPAELEKMLKKVQRSWRKKHPDIEGTISKRGLRYQYEHYGFDRTMASLDKAYRYSEGYAYVDNVLHLIERIKLNLNKDASSEMENVVQLIQQRILEFREEWIAPCYSALYDWERHLIDGSECARQIRAIIS